MSRATASTAATYAPSLAPLGAPPDAPLDRAESDRRLFKRYLVERDPVDRDAIVERFLPLARQLAARYQRPDEPFDDVYQVACFGLVKAVDRFDVHRGVAFSSYAAGSQLPLPPAPGLRASPRHSRPVRLAARRPLAAVPGPLPRPAGVHESCPRGRQPAARRRDARGCRAGCRAG